MATSTKSQVQSKKLTGWKKWAGLGILILAAFSFFFAQSALWLSTSVFNQKAFVSTTSEVLLSQESRDAIAGVIVDKAFQDRPVLQRVAGNQATSLISGLLGSDLTANLFDRLANRVYSYLTSPDRQDIAIDLTGIKTPLSGIVSFAESRGTEVKFDPANIPDTITLIDSDSIPDFSSYIRATLVLNVFFWLVAAALLITYVLLQEQGRIRRFYQVCLTLAAVAFIALASGPFIPPAVASFISLIDLRGIATDLTTAFLQPFATQMWITLIVVGLAALAVSLRRQMHKGVVYITKSFEGTKKS